MSCRLTTAATTLIKEYDAVVAWIEKTTLARITATTWPPMQNHNGKPLRIAAFFKIDAVLSIGSFQKRSMKRLNGWVKLK